MKMRCRVGMGALLIAGTACPALAQSGHNTAQLSSRSTSADPLTLEEVLQSSARSAPDIIAAGNIGCMMQIGSGTGVPVVHTVELLDWATGGPRPRALTAGG